MSHPRTSLRAVRFMGGALLAVIAPCALTLLSSCSGQAGPAPAHTLDEAATGTCPVTITIPSQNLEVGSSIQISVTQSTQSGCQNFTNAMIAYIDGQECDEAPYPYPNAGCKTTGGAQNFSTSTWVAVTPGTHVINVNNWNSSGTVGDSTHVTFSYTPADAGTDGGSWKFAPNVPVAALTQNNTSACGSSTAPCSEAWNQTQTVKYQDGPLAGKTVTVDGFWDNAVATGPSAPGSSNGHVSKVSVTTLLPGYPDVPVLLASQNWWSQSGHIDNGETSTTLQQAQNQVADQISRGFAGQTVAWDGPGTTQDKAIANIMTSAEAADASGDDYKFAVRFEDNYLASTANCGKDPSQAQLLACLNAGIAYVAKQYGGSKAYLTDKKSGKPILFFFLSNTAYYPLVADSGIEPSGMVFVMLKPHGLPATTNVIGEYAWVAPTDVGNTSTTGSGGTFEVCADSGFSSSDSFFTEASSNQSALLVADAYKGFDDSLATWSLSRVIDQQCGMTWLQTFDHTGAFGGSSSYQGSLNYLESGKDLSYVMVDTWDDYEEGTEIETGIDNCMSSLSVALSGSTLSWTPTWGKDPMDSTVSGSEATVSEYSVYAASPGASEVMWIDDVPCTGGTCPHSLDVSLLGIQGGPFDFYVQAVGQPSIVNHLAGPTSATYTK